MTVHEASLKWGLKERRVTMLCRNGRIIGVQKEGKTWIIPDNAPMPKDARYKEEEVVVEENVTTTKYTEKGAYRNVTEAFSKRYGRVPTNVAFTPYCLCPVGAHCDHQKGKITGFAIDKGIYMAYGPKQNGIIEIQSLQFPKRAQWHVLNTPDTKQGDWADHLRGAVIALSRRFPLSKGLSAVIDGELPIGGLSSSASVIITFISALCQLNRIRLSEAEMIEISKEAENLYVGVNSGKLDQSCEIYCRKDHLLYLDTKDDSYHLIKENPNCPEYEFIIFFSGLGRSLASSKFNMRVDECRSAAYALKAFEGMAYGNFADTSLRDVPYEVFLKHRDRLPESFRKRAEHWYDESFRVEKAAKAFEEGDIEEFGKLCFESGQSSITNWETGAPELIKLFEIIKSTPGVYGGRFSGSGFKGCCMAIVNPNREESVLENVEREYLQAFPKMKGKYSAHVCHSGDGVKL